MARYKTKPCEIEAIQFNGNNLKEIEEFAKEKCMMARFSGTECTGIGIDTLEGCMNASVGDYIIKGLKGEFYPCKPDIFEKKYELIQKLEGHDMETRTEEYIRGYNQGTIDRAEELQKCREYGYNKAIDEFVERITLPLTEEAISRIVDEMKGGV